MKIGRIVKPGQPGTKRLVQQYGDNLICVRYRYDASNRKMLKTIELVIEEEPWNPNGRKVRQHKTVDLRIAVDEAQLRNRVKKAGGKWDPQKKVWRLAYREVVKLGLRDRMMEQP